MLVRHSHCSRDGPLGGLPNDRTLGRMDKLNNCLTLLANIGVLAGTGFPAYVIRQNTKAIHAQTSEAILAATYIELQRTTANCRQYERIPD